MAVSFFTGTDYADGISGTTADDAIYGLGGLDQLDGLEGDDSLFGGDFVDVLTGRAGDVRWASPHLARQVCTARPGDRNAF